MPQYKLYYFQVRNLAEPARQLFALSGIPYEDVRMTQEEWVKVKNDMPFGHIPVLEVDGFKIPNSVPINRYLARKFGYAGKTPEEEAMVDALADEFNNYYQDVKTYFYSKIGFMDQDVEERKKAVLLPNRDAFYGLVTKFLKKSKSGYLLDSGLTYIDLMIADNLTSYLGFIPDFIDNFPEIKIWHQKVINTPKIKEWIAKRPNTPC